MAVKINRLAVGDNLFRRMTMNILQSLIIMPSNSRRKMEPKWSRKKIFRIAAQLKVIKISGRDEVKRRAKQVAVDLHLLAHSIAILQSSSKQRLVKFKK